MPDPATKQIQSVRNNTRDKALSTIGKKPGRRAPTSSFSTALPSVGTFADANAVFRMFDRSHSPHSTTTTTTATTSTRTKSVTTRATSPSHQQQQQQQQAQSTHTTSASHARHHQHQPHQHHPPHPSFAVVEEGPSPFSCRVCARVLASKTALRNHITQEHEGKRVAKCPHCDRAFTRSSQLRKHIATAHDERTGEFYCDKCTFKNREADLFNQHVRTHNKCPFCRNEFTQLSRHVPKCPFRP